MCVCQSMCLSGAIILYTCETRCSKDIPRHTIFHRDIKNMPGYMHRLHISLCRYISIDYLHNASTFIHWYWDILRNAPVTTKPFWRMWIKEEEYPYISLFPVFYRVCMYQSSCLPRALIHYICDIRRSKDIHNAFN